MNKIKTEKQPRIGIYTMGLKKYWSQFAGLKERLEGYGEFLAKKTGDMGAEVFAYGLVDCEEAGRACGEYFSGNHVDLILAHACTYVTSASVLPIHQICKAKTVILNLQPTARMNYDTATTGEWLSQCGACPVPELSNAFERAGIGFHVISGLLGMSRTAKEFMADENTAARPEAKRAWKEIGEWVEAAKVKRNLSGARFGILGNAYSGMLDMYSDYTMLQAQTGVHIEVIEMCDLNRLQQQVTEKEVVEKRREIENVFQIAQSGGSDSLAAKPTAEQLDWSARVAAALEKLVREFGLDALTYYYHGSPGSEYEKLQSGLIVGNSLLTAKGIPCAGEGDLKTCLAMKICDIAGKGGSFCEIVTTDYVDGTILLGHDGPFHLAIAKEKPLLRGMGLYHGKQGTGISVEAKVITGKITNLGCTQTADGRLRFLITQAQSINGPIMNIGNTQTPVRFLSDPDTYMEEWFSYAPTHHFAMSVGHNGALFEKVCILLSIPCVQLDKGLS